MRSIPINLLFDSIRFQCRRIKNERKEKPQPIDDSHSTVQEIFRQAHKSTHFLCCVQQNQKKTTKKKKKRKERHTQKNFTFCYYDSLLLLFLLVQCTTLHCTIPFYMTNVSRKNIETKKME